MKSWNILAITIFTFRTYKIHAFRHLEERVYMFSTGMWALMVIYLLNY